MSERSITLAEFGVMGSYAHLPIPVVKGPASLPKGSPIRFGNIVCRIEKGGWIGVVTSVKRYKGGFLYTVMTPHRGSYEAKVSHRIDPEKGVPATQEIEVLREGNAFRRKRRS